MARRDNPGAAKPGGGIVSARCEFSDLDPVACAHCRGGDPFPDVRRRTTSPSSRLLPARFHGRCGDCGESFTPGTLITPTEDGWIAECCAEEGM
jgi:hypothetical protein